MGQEQLQAHTNYSAHSQAAQTSRIEESLLAAAQPSQHVDWFCSPLVLQSLENPGFLVLSLLPPSRRSCLLLVFLCVVRIRVCFGCESLEGGNPETKP